MTDDPGVDVDALLAPAGSGGVVEVGLATDLAAIAVAARDRGARVGLLKGPASKDELLDMVARELGFPGWFGRNWDALDELLVFPDPPDDRVILVVWDDADRLAAVDPASASTARDVFASAAQERAALGAASLVVIIRTGAVP